MKPVKALADEALNYLQNAVGDIASDMCSSSSGFLDEPWKKRIKQTKKNGCRDIQGWLGDELYNDSDIIQDLLGDHIHDLVGGDQVKYQEVLDELSKHAFPALQKALEALRR